MEEEETDKKKSSNTKKSAKAWTKQKTKGLF